MTVREYAKSVGFEVVGKLKRLPDASYGREGKEHSPLWVDEAGTEYWGSSRENDGYCIITADGGVI